MSPRKQGRQGTSLLEAIKTAAWEQVSSEGAAALSLRAIARGLGITAPAIYNYFHRRDDLVTALVIDAYAAFGANQAAAVSRLRADDHAGRLRALGVAYREWAVTNPERYLLMFSAPFPGYVLPAAQVGPVAGQALAVLIRTLEAARKARALRAPRSTPPKVIGPVPGLSPGDAALLYGSTDPAVLVKAVHVWARVHGLVSIELSRQFPPYLADPARLYREELEALVGDVISTPSPRSDRVRKGASL